MIITKKIVREVRAQIEKHGWNRGGSGPGVCLMQAIPLYAMGSEWDSFLCSLPGVVNGPGVHPRMGNGARQTTRWNDDPARTWEHVDALLAYAEQVAPE